MKDFIMTALPWVCLGVALAVCAVNFNKRKTEKQEHDNYMTEGMCFGMCFGMCIVRVVWMV